jgi:hypothetical protein
MWEIFMLGEVPYPGLSWSLDFLKRLEGGLRMEKPDSASEPMYELQTKKLYQ